MFPSRGFQRKGPGRTPEWEGGTLFRRPPPEPVGDSRAEWEVLAGSAGLADCQLASEVSDVLGPRGSARRPDAADQGFRRELV